MAQLSRRSGTPGGRAANAGGGPDDRGGGRPAVSRDCGPLGIGCLDFRPVAVVAGVALAVVACVALCAEIAAGGVVAGAATAVGTAATSICIRFCPAARTGAEIIVESAGGAGSPRGAAVETVGEAAPGPRRHPYL